MRKQTKFITSMLLAAVMLATGAIPVSASAHKPSGGGTIRSVLTVQPSGNEEKRTFIRGDAEAGKAKAAPPSGKKSTASRSSYKNVSDAYAIVNAFRTNRKNQWYWDAYGRKVTTYRLGELKRDPVLEKTARLRAREQWTMYYVRHSKTHDRPNGKAWETAFPPGYRCRGENIAWGQRTSYGVIANPQIGWAETYKRYSGQEHRRNILDKDYTKVGIACYVKNGKTCWVMCFGR